MSDVRGRGLVDPIAGWLYDVSARAEAIVATNPEQLAAPSLLPGWSRAHVATHLARNADGFCELLEWARTGLRRPMYPSVEVRNAAIDTGSIRAALDIAADLTAADGRLTTAMASLPPDAWDAQVEIMGGRPIPAWKVPLLRSREVAIHLVDLDLGVAFDDLPPGLCSTLIDETVSRIVGTGLTLRATNNDAATTWEIASDGAATTISGSAADLLAWITGRPTSGSLHSTALDGSIPPAPNWS